MPQSTRIRANQGVGQEQTGQRVGLAVVANKAIPVQQDRTQGIVRAVTGFAETYQQKQAADLAELNKLSESFGYQDAAANNVDEERLGRDSAYAAGVNSLRATTEGLDWHAKSIQDLEAKLKDNPNMDFDKWRQEQIQAYIGDNPPTTAEELQTRNRFLAQFEQNARYSYEAKSAEYKHKEQMTAFADATTSLLRNAKPTDAQFKAFIQQSRDKVGLGDQETEDAVGTILLSKLGQENDVHAYELAKSMGYLDKGGWGSKFEQQKAQADRAIEAERLDAMRNDLGRRMKLNTELGGMADRGQLTTAFLTKMEQDGEITTEEAMHYWNRQESESKRRVAQAENAALKAQKQAAVSFVLDNGDARTVAAYRLAGGKESALKSEMDRRWLEAEASGDPDKVVDVVLAAQRSSVFPPGMKNYLDSLDPSNKKEFVRQASLFRTLVNPMARRSVNPDTGAVETQEVPAGVGNFLKASLTARGYANLKQFSDLVDSGVDPNAAVEAMASNAIPYAETYAEARGAKDVNTGLQAVMKDMGVTNQGRAADIFEHLVANHMTYGGGRSAAIAKASQELKDRYIQVDGAFVDKRWAISSAGDLTEDLPEIWQTYRDRKLTQETQAKYGEGTVGELKLLPHPTKPQVFTVYSEGVDRLLPGENGGPREIPVDELYKFWLDDRWQQNKQNSAVSDAPVSPTMTIVPGLGPAF